MKWECECECEWEWEWEWATKGQTGRASVGQILEGNVQMKWPTKVFDTRRPILTESSYIFLIRFLQIIKESTDGNVPNGRSGAKTFMI